MELNNVGWLPALPTDTRLGWKGTDSDKHSNLVQYGRNDYSKSFLVKNPRDHFFKIFTATIYESS
jgi:hypothetical protein